MPIPEAEKKLPRSTSMLDAFEIPLRQYFSIGKTEQDLEKKPIRIVGKVLSSYIDSGIAYLANRCPDDYIKEVGTTTWKTINKKRVQVFATNDMLTAAIYLGVPEEIAFRNYSNNDQPHVLFMRKKSELADLDTALILMPPNFITRARNNPIDALATLTWVSSHVRDLANYRLVTDSPELIIMRANATEAHFLKEAVRRHPEAAISEESKSVLSLYPEGIFSSKLPKNILYKGTSDEPRYH